MKYLVLPLLAVSLMATTGHAATIDGVNIPGFVFPRIDYGCLTGSMNASRYPTTVYDPATKERITYNLSRCTGGFIASVNDETSKTWNVDIDSDGNASGRDLAGNKWRYDRKTKLFTNLSTGTTCGAATLRQVCD
jgi:hypothetical protein